MGGEDAVPTFQMGPAVLGTTSEDLMDNYTAR